MAPETAPTDEDVDDFLASITSMRLQGDARVLDGIFRRVTGSPPVMWGASIVGYGAKVLMYADGRSADWMALGFAPRTSKLAIYGLGDVPGRAQLLARLGPHSTGASCVYVPSMAAIDATVLEELARAAIAHD